MSIERLRRQMIAAINEHLATGQKPKIPEAGRVLWSHFTELSLTRTYHAGGPHAIAYAEIEAWSRLSRVELEPHHIEIIRALDSAWMTHAYGRIRRQGSGTQALSLPKSGLKPTPEFFDAMFG